MMDGRVLAHYRLLERIGVGGMGEVYRATDTKLGREVAIKVLPEAFARDPDRLARFDQEARLLAALNHPHIAAIYGLEESAGTRFLVLELVEGETLAERIARGPLSVAEALAVCLQIAEALEVAHERGIIHRDLKPANLKVTPKGNVKVLDFGLGKTLGAGAASPVDLSRTPTATLGATREGMILGTVAYMSPEQARGQPVDQRSDIFSFGTVLYEMLAGRLPFQGATATDVLSAIIRDEPPPISRIAPAVPAELERIIGKAMEKRAPLRYQTTRDLITDLERLRRVPLADSPAAARPVAARTVPEQASIVVLPFENLSPDPDNAFFADGLTEELIADLARVRALRVISRTSAMHYKGTTKQVPAIARELNVTYVLEGSVRRAANSLRITAQLIDATTDAHLWADKYSGGLEDVFELQERLSRRIVDALKVRLAPDEEERLGARPTRDPRAYDVWLRARHQARLFTKEGIDGAIQLVNQAIAMAGESALFNAALAYLYWGSYDAGFGHGAETLGRIESYATRALALDPNLSQALMAMGLARYKHGDLQGLVRYAKRAVQSDLDSDALMLLGFVLADVGKTQEALLYADQGIARDPFSSIACVARSFVDLVDGKFDSALTRVRDWTERLAPDEPFMLWWVGQTAMHAGREGEARAAFGRAAEAGTGFWADMCELGKSALKGDRVAVRHVLGATTLEQVAKTDEYYPCFLASCLARVGETEEALEWVRRAVSWGFANHRFLSVHCRFFAPLRGDARFQALLATAREKERCFEV